jgi:hypothetical protein
MKYRVRVFFAGEHKREIGDFDTIDLAEEKITEILKNGFTIKHKRGQTRYPSWSVIKITINKVKVKEEGAAFAVIDHDIKPD